MGYAEEFASRVRLYAHSRSVELALDPLPEQNVVASGDLGNIEVVIRAFARKRMYTFVPPRFEAAVVRYVGDQATTLLLFRTGKAVIAGSKSPTQTIAAMHKLRFDLARDHIYPTKVTFTIVNMVFSAKIPGVHGIDIAKLRREHMEDSAWTPTVFPGLRLLKCGLSTRLFDTNNVVIMGATDPAQAQAIMAQLTNLSNKYRSDYIPPPNKRYAYRLLRHKQVFSDMPMAIH